MPGQLAVERMESHAAVAEVLARQGPVTENPHSAVIARHLTLTDRCGEAIHFYLAAVQQASGQAAYKEAIEHIDAALNVLDAVPEEI